MAEDLGKLSPEQIQKLANTISEAKDLTGQQEEIIKKVLAGETEIGKLRISSLEKYFDVYSRSLDKVARKHSALNDAFLFLSNQLTEEYNELSSDMNQLGKQLSNTAKELKNAAGSASGKDSSQKSSKETNTNEILSLAIKRLENVFEKATTTSKVTQNSAGSGSKDILGLFTKLMSYRELGATSESGGGGNGGSGSGGNGSIDDNLPINNTITVLDELRNALGSLDLDKKDVVKFFSEILAAEKAHAKIIKDLQKKNQVATTNDEEKYLRELTRIRDNFKDQILRHEENLSEARLKLEHEYNQTKEDQELRAIEFRLSKLKEATDAELKLAEDLSKVTAQLKTSGTKKGQKELGAARANQVNAEEELKSRQEVEAQIVKLRQKLEDEARAKNGGKLLKKDAIAIEAQLNAKYQKRLKNIKKLTRKVDLTYMFF